MALTRAKWNLHQFVPQRFYVSGQSGVGDKHVYGTVSRFMPLAVAALCEACGPPRHEAVDNAPPSAMPSTTLDVAARLRDRWVWVRRPEGPPPGHQRRAPEPKAAMA